MSKPHFRCFKLPASIHVLTDPNCLCSSEMETHTGRCKQNWMSNLQKVLKRDIQVAEIEACALFITSVLHITLL